MGDITELLKTSTLLYTTCFTLFTLMKGTDDYIECMYWYRKLNPDMQAEHGKPGYLHNLKGRAIDFLKLRLEKLGTERLGFEYSKAYFSNKNIQ